MLAYTIWLHTVGNNALMSSPVAKESIAANMLCKSGMIDDRSTGDVIQAAANDHRCFQRIVALEYNSCQINISH